MLKGSNSTVVKISNVPQIIDETTIRLLCSAIESVQLEQNKAEYGMNVVTVTFKSSDEARTFRQNFDGTQPSPRFSEPLEISFVAVPIPEHLRTILILGFPKSVKKEQLFSFADTFCIHYAHTRFPEAEFIPQCEEDRINNIKTAKLVFETEGDVDQFWNFKCHHQIAAGLTMHRWGRDNVRQEKVIAPPELPVGRSIVFFEKLPPNITENDLIGLIGSKDLIRRDSDGNCCIKIFRGRVNVSAKVIMNGAHAAKTLVDSKNGQIFYPFMVPIQVSL